MVSGQTVKKMNIKMNIPVGVQPIGSWKGGHMTKF